MKFFGWEALIPLVRTHWVLPLHWHSLQLSRVEERTGREEEARAAGEATSTIVMFLR